MSTRQRLPNRRNCITLALECCGVRYTATAACFADGSLAEIFLGNRKAGSQSDANAKDSAVMASLALQHGASLETLRHAVLRDSQGNAATPLSEPLTPARMTSKGPEAVPGAFMPLNAVRCSPVGNAVHAGPAHVIRGGRRS